MLYPTNGTHLYIADAPAEDAGAFPSAGWVEIGETEALGLLGVEWDMASSTKTTCEGAVEVIHAKQAFNKPPMELVFGADPTDPGQMVLWRALNRIEAYPFRLVFPDGVTTRLWFALVVTVAEVFDSANSVIRMQATLQPIGSIQRSEAV